MSYQNRSSGPRVRYRPYQRRKKVCEFTRLGIIPDYKDIKRLERFVTAQGKILPRRRTGLTAKMQRRLTVAIKRARHMSLLPFVAAHSTGRSGR
ncbi:MAG: 30S ribosomal protein S18 [Chloroflexi bacterium AL-W]|nr:30S ribosomal protein S18 [Chloroflexi bacterium AL-N1]NOK68018.1 30S ribosomal protein S18 [Chloroflexi bacterium AL-N10]NOK73358.1 30S ribosomal protein S18 [Chloroflexi bacterium AL-N5]NOK83272.1 30S ribosomal protein S18 [Chloroflexi bacterium AL-W]NOK87689.1 30S ribosomal protein S18 [Chloroflexi bacterium AL-N15]